MSQANHNSNDKRLRSRSVATKDQEARVKNVCQKKHAGKYHLNRVSAWPHWLDYPNDLDAESQAEQNKHSLIEPRNESPIRKTDATV